MRLATYMMPLGSFSKVLLYLYRPHGTGAYSMQHMKSILPPKGKAMKDRTFASGENRR